MLSITVECKKPALLGITGKCADHPNTKYFDTGYGMSDRPFSGVHTFDINMPVSPKKLNLNLYNKSTGGDDGIVLVKTEAKNLPTGRVGSIDAYTRNFLDFAVTFADQAGYLQAGKVYEYMDGQYLIKYSPDIRNYKTGEYIESPARVGRTSGVVEISQKHFLGYSVPVRVFIFCHEWVHHIRKTTNEYVADNFGLILYRSMGFPDIEAIYAFTRVFNLEGQENDQEKMARARNILNQLSGR